MTFFMTNNSGQLLRKGKTNVYGEFSFAKPVTVKCAVVKLIDKTTRTAVRTDLSATRGNAEEETTTANILFPPSIKIQIDDMFKIAGLSMRVTQVQPQFDVLGRYDHDEVTLEHTL